MRVTSNKTKILKHTGVGSGVGQASRSTYNSVLSTTLRQGGSTGVGTGVGTGGGDDDTGGWWRWRAVVVIVSVTIVAVLTSSSRC